MRNAAKKTLSFNAAWIALLFLRKRLTNRAYHVVVKREKCAH
jgi:hypothetical protein